MPPLQPNHNNSLGERMDERWFVSTNDMEALGADPAILPLDSREQEKDRRTKIGISR
jgi:hypothetical protein